MNVDAMIKHHQAVTEVITHAMSDYASAATGTSWNKACFAFEADAILCALSRSGFRIIGPDEVDQVTLDKAADYIEGSGGVIPGTVGFASLVSGNRQPCMSGDGRDRLHRHVRRDFDDATASLATAIRSLKGCRDAQ